VKEEGEPPPECPRKIKSSLLGPEGLEPHFGGLLPTIQ